MPKSTELQINLAAEPVEVARQIEQAARKHHRALATKYYDLPERTPTPARERARRKALDAEAITRQWRAFRLLLEKEITDAKD